VCKRSFISVGRRGYVSRRPLSILDEILDALRILYAIAVDNAPTAG
jgi:hypothetical protein